LADCSKSHGRPTRLLNDRCKDERNVKSTGFSQVRIKFLKLI
jgi:hypothetical protein